MAGREQHDATLIACQPALARRAMLESARLAHLARRSLDYGVRTGSVSVDLHRVRRRAHSLVQQTAQFAAPPPDTAAKPRSGGSEAGFLEEASVLELESLPEHLLVVGGEAAGVEIAQLYRRFGSRVSLVEKAAQLLPDEDRDVAAAVAEFLRQDGVAVFLESGVTETHETPDRRVAVRIRSAAGERLLSGSHLALLAPGVNRDDAGPLRTNRRSRGHMSAGTTRCCQLYTDPPLASVGLTEAEAQRRGLVFRVAKLPLVRETRGFAKVVVDAATRQFLGAAVLAPEAGEIVAMLQVAMIGRMPYPALRDGMQARTPAAQALRTLLAALEETHSQGAHEAGRNAGPLSPEKEQNP